MVVLMTSSLDMVQASHYKPHKSIWISGVNEKVGDTVWCSVCCWCEQW